ncbi:sensor histidine kinase [Paenibacillus hexagrammi]|uniref:Histidine kinase n=1 Tax=Paenibacillus hexagrammi TaxID=2908839 RepID=A0ABY3SH63_9BACL|nr:histidine kinase [Paenibacillus sp. YPD9-1]UJF32440.1 histidine kinase [Paenibacillus sp. YPD9-1]
MTIVNSVRFKIFIGFVLVVAPLIVFLVINNVYSMNVVRDQISQNYSKLLEQYVMDTDNTLKEFDNYLFHLYSDPDVINMTVYNEHSDDYVLAKQRLYNKFSKQIDIYNLINTFYFYSKNTDDLLVATRENSYYDERVQAVKQVIIESDNNHSEGHEDWKLLISKSGVKYLVKSNTELGAGFSTGMLIRMDSLVQPLSNWDVGIDGGTLAITNEGLPLTEQFFNVESYQQFEKQLELKKSEYHVVRDKKKDEQYLVVKQSSTHAPIQYLLIIAEKNMLKNLPYLQVIIYFLPLGGAIVLAMYLLYLQGILFKPLTQLIRGMRKIAQGELQVRLKEGGSTEFAVLITIFNNMVNQIENLKISVYEEKIRVQQAEFKHLQVQINPHFYMNSLNIIYNLAALKDTKSVQKMSLHLADYFRFIMRTNRTTLTLRDELQHIANYLEIQVMRYPDHLTFQIDVSDQYAEYYIPPLIIQPFVENSIIHGFTKEHGVFHIQVKALPDPSAPEDYFILTVIDNGNGYDEGMLRSLNSEQYLQESGDKHLGIWNVRHRLRMNYGEQVSISFQNGTEYGVGHGAVVILKLPFVSIMKS